MYPKPSSNGYIQWQIACLERRPNVVATNSSNAHVDVSSTLPYEGYTDDVQRGMILPLIALVRTLDLRIHSREMVVDVVLLLVRVALERSDT